MGERVNDIVKSKWSKETGDANLMNVVRIAMSTVEDLSSTEVMGSDDKNERVKDILPLVIDQGTQLGKIPVENQVKFKKKVVEKEIKVDQIMDLIVRVSNDPNAIQAGKWIFGEISNCIAGCSAKRSQTRSLKKRVKKGVKK